MTSTAAASENPPRRTAAFARMRELLGWLRSRSSSATPATLSSGQLNLVRRTLRECLDGIGGEASARKRVALLAEIYAHANDDGRREYLKLLASEFSPDDEHIAAVIRDYLQAKGPDRRKIQRELRHALNSPRVTIFKQFNLLPDGVKFLVSMRTDVSRFVRATRELEVIDEELYGLLASWFDVGNLELRRITWSSPAALLEKLIAYEAVHEIRSWSDLRHRLDSDRRCYAFFHPRMPDEPLVFVEIALVKDMAASVQVLLDESAPVGDPREATAAIFYSISSTQNGLRGVSFGGFLIKRVVEQLLADFPRLNTFATLSPIPGFRRWLDARLNAKDPILFQGFEAKELVKLGSNDRHAALAAALEKDFSQDPAAAELLEPILVPLCARYLAVEQEENRPLDPVARFHLGNGAQLERINWLADTSSRGIKQSASLMVNYLYRLSDIEDNHEAYEREGKIATSRSVRKLIKARGD